MHYPLDLAVPAAGTAARQQELLALKETIGLSVHLGAAKQLAGNVLAVHVLRRHDFSLPFLIQEQAY